VNQLLRRPRFIDTAPLVALALLDLVARLAVPLALLAMLDGHTNAALLAAALVSGLAVVRGWSFGRVMQRVVVRIWRALAEALAACEVLTLQARSETHDVALMMDAAHRGAELEATVLPRLYADAVGLSLVLLVALQRLPWTWLALGLLVAMLLLLLLVPLRGRLARHEQRAWRRYSQLATSLEALVGGATELRAHGREATFVGELVAGVEAMADEQRRANSLSASLSLLPFGLALLAAAAPLRAGLVAIGGDSGPPFAELALIGGTAFVLALGVLRSIEAIARSQPQQQLLTELLASSEAREASSGDEPLLDEPIVFDELSVRHEGATHDTPYALSHEWTSGGLAVLGSNGSGKSSLALALLGQIAPTGGRVTIGALDSRDLDWTRLGARVAYLPQHAYLDEAQSVAWHLRFVRRDISDGELEHALRRVGLYPVLQRHDEQAPLEVAVGELSGGERRRLLLARALLPNGGAQPKLIILDEPEAGLDASARHELCVLCAELAGAARVMLIAHDPAVVPDAFARVTCTRVAARHR
jgi:ABC-type transport system involved in cytochrome bd biosynthesis fused ATPase/permease subunit